MRTKTKSVTKRTRTRSAIEASSPGDIDAFLRAMPADKRTALTALRSTVKAAAPKASELINYGVPMFRLDGKNLVSFGAAAGHCTFYVQSPAVMRAHAAELKGYKVGKGSIQFSADKPLPRTLVAKLVKARIAENAKP